MKRRQILALDIGSTKVACVVGRMNGPADFEIDGVGLARYPLTVTAWPGEPEQIAEAIERALQQADPSEPVDRALVAVTHPELAHHRATAQVELAQEPITVGDGAIRRVRAQAVAQSLAVDRELLRVESLGYDGNGFSGVRNPRGLLASRLRGTFQIVAMPANLQRTVTRALDAAGLELDRMVYSLPAAAAACVSATVDPREVGIDPAARSQRLLLVDLGGRTTDAAILDRMAVERAVSIGWGGAVVVDAVATACRLTREHALAASLEGLGSSKIGVRPAVEGQLALLQACLQEVLAEGPLPDQAIVTGGGALIDSLVEWIEARTGVPACIGRSPRAVRFGELPTQIALTAAIGLLELSCRASTKPSQTSGRLFGRLLHGTKTLLEEYF